MPNRHRDPCLFPNRRLSNRDSFARLPTDMIVYVCVCINDEGLERRKWFRREITNYGFSNLNVIRSLLSFAQRELIYERTEIGWPHSRRMRIELLFEGNTRCKYVYTKVDY